LAAAAAAREKRRARRRAKAKERGYRDEYMDLEPEIDSPPPQPDEARVSASLRGAGPMGFSGTATESDAPAAGLTRLPGDAFGGGPVAPMLPTTWHADDQETDKGTENGKGRKKP
jgi:hypothetical protein